MSHQALNSAARHTDTVLVQLVPHLVSAGHAQDLLPHPQDLRAQPTVTDLARRRTPVLAAR